MKNYNASELCVKLNITIWTLRNWYAWERKSIKNGVVDKPYLPQPFKDEHAKGKPRYWDEEMLSELKKYKKTIVTGRNGVYGAYSNPSHKETNKYKKSLTVE